MDLLRQCEKQASVDNIIALQTRLNQDEKLQARIKSFNRYVLKQTKEERIYESMDLAWIKNQM